MRRTAAGEQMTRLIMTMFRFQGSLERHGIALTRPFGQTPARWQVLSAAWGETRSVPQIARRMGLSRQAVQRIVNLFIEEGLATLAPNPAHRGSPIVRLTPRGVAVVTKLNAAQSAWINRVSRTLEGRRLAAAADAVAELTCLLDREDAHVRRSKGDRSAPARPVRVRATRRPWHAAHGASVAWEARKATD